MKLKLLAAAMCGIAFAPSAFAQEAKPNLYWSAGYGILPFEDDYGLTARLGVVQGKLGYRISPNFGVEVEGTLGVKSDRIYLLNGFDADASINHGLGSYGVVFLPVGGGLDLFGRAGFASAELEVEFQGATGTGEDSGTAFGGGVIWDVGPVDLRGEYTLYNFDGNSDYFALSIGGKF